MKRSFEKILSWLLILFFSVVGSEVFSAPPNSELWKAKKEAEARGFIFETSRDEIVAKAKKEGRLAVLTGLDPAAHAPMMNTFKRKYPFIDPVEIVELASMAASLAFIQQLKVGQAREWDAAHITTEYYSEYLPLIKKFDLLGMAEQGVLKIPPGMVDPKVRSIIAIGSSMEVAGYNRHLISEEKVPDTWDDFLKPEFKGRKFLVDIRPTAFSDFPACPDAGLGLEWMLKYARALRAQEPIWVRGNTRALTAMIAGEYALHQATHFQSITRLVRKNPAGSLRIKIVEPAPIGLTELKGVLETSSRPYTALLFLEHMAGPEGQDIMDEYGPVKGSIFFPGSALWKATEGKKVCVNDFTTHHNSGKWREMAIEAMGFPKAERKKR